jgi:cohesin loading factor subunit SCC2
MPAQSSQPNTFQTNAFAHSLMHHIAPSNAYPTPPPPSFSASSSSLANALGTPSNQAAATNGAGGSNPSQFFESFLANKLAEIKAPGRQERKPQSSHAGPSTPPMRTLAIVPESPDPLALSTVKTPKKRKPTSELESPSLKRVQSDDNFRRHNLSTPFKTPSTIVHNTPHTPVPPTPMSVNHSGRVKLTPYVQVPPKPWLTPTSSRKPKSEEESPNDLGGYGTPASSPTKPSSLGTGRRGDRDERGMIDCLMNLPLSNANCRPS